MKQYEADKNQSKIVLFRGQSRKNIPVNICFQYVSPHEIEADYKSIRWQFFF